METKQEKGKKLLVRTEVRKMLADVHTPVSIYLRLRDRFRDTILLESTDYHASENSLSIIGVHAVAGIEIISKSQVEFKLPGQQPEKLPLSKESKLPKLLWDFMQRFEVKESAT